MKQIIEELNLTCVNVKEMAENLGITLDSLKYNMKKYKIKRPRKPFNNICIKCKEQKFTSDFYNTSGSNFCKKCYNKTILERQRETKEKAVAYKGGKCQICNYNKCLGALQFHHIDKKNSSWKNFKMRTFNTKFMEELDKCVLLCANCHAEEHTKYCID